MLRTFIRVDAGKIHRRCKLLALKRAKAPAKRAQVGFSARLRFIPFARPIK
jgi:hypothetical protein